MGGFLNKKLDQVHKDPIYSAKALGNVIAGNGADGRHSAKAQAARADAGMVHPNDMTYNSALDGAGNLQSNYQLGAPAQVKAGSLTAGTLNAHTLGNYDNVAIKSILGDTQKRLDGIQMDGRGMDALRDRALATGPSAWANLAKQKQGLDEQTTIENAAKSGNGAMANAMSQVAMRGGLSSGASLRAARQSAQDANLAAQQIRRGGMQDRLGIDVTDENQRLDLLKGLPAAELAWIQPQMQKAQMLTGVQSDEQARNLTADMSNREALMKRDVYNADALTGADKFNIGTALDKDKFNIGNKFTADQFNTGTAQDANKFNITNLLGAHTADNNANLQKWQTQMQNWGAGKTANAMAGSGKK